MPSSPIRIAAMQARAIPGDVHGNARRAAEGVAAAAALGASVAVFPELHLCGYDLPRLLTPDGGVLVAEHDGRVEDRRLAALRRAAADSGVTVVIGAAVRRDGVALTNSLLLIDTSGAVRVAYDKQHLWHEDEAGLFTTRGTGTSIAVGDWRFGLGICYDISFPEHARAAALAGAHAYLAPSAFASGREHRAHIYLAARALENTIYTVFVNPVGGPQTRPCDGRTAVFGPDGSTIAYEKVPAEAIVVADLDPAELTRVRGFLRMLSECV